VNRRQFGMPPGAQVFPRDLAPPDRIYRDETQFDFFGEPVELHHAEAETDDATWVWLHARLGRRPRRHRRQEAGARAAGTR
jgi:hypothetical protein